MVYFEFIGKDIQKEQKKLAFEARYQGSRFEKLICFQCLVLLKKIHDFEKKPTLIPSEPQHTS